MHIKRFSHVNMSWSEAVNGNAVIISMGYYFICTVEERMRYDLCRQVRAENGGIDPPHSAHNDVYGRKTDLEILHASIKLPNMKEMVGGCCVCSDERGWAENPLVYCDGHGCNVAVHQGLYQNIMRSDIKT